MSRRAAAGARSSQGSLDRWSFRSTWPHQSIDALNARTAAADGCSSSVVVITADAQRWLGQRCCKDQLTGTKGTAGLGRSAPSRQRIRMFRTALRQLQVTRIVTADGQCCSMVLPVRPCPFDSTLHCDAAHSCFPKEVAVHHDAVTLCVVIMILKLLLAKWRHGTSI